MMKSTGVIPGVVTSRVADAASADEVHPPELPAAAASPAPEVSAQEGKPDPRQEPGPSKPGLMAWAMNIDRPVTIGGTNGVPARGFTGANIDQQENGTWDFSVDFEKQIVWVKWDTGSGIAMASVPLSWCAIRWRVTA
jgi:hypothetical protein